MAHGVMGLGPAGFAFTIGFTSFIYYLSRSFKGPDGPKYLVDPVFVELAKEYQPGIVPEHYIKKPSNQSKQ